MEYDDDNLNWQPYLDELSPLPNQVIPFATTSYETLEKIFSIVKLSTDDVILDLGCGDGRVILYAAEKYSVRGYGVEINESLLAKANEAAKAKNVEHLVQFLYKSFLDETFDLTFINDNGTKVYPTKLVLYMTSDALKLVENKLIEYLNQTKKLNKDVKIVTNVFLIKNWTPIFSDHNLYIYDVTSIPQ